MSSVAAVGALLAVAVVTAGKVESGAGPGDHGGEVRAATRASGALPRPGPAAASAAAVPARPGGAGDDALTYFRRQVPRAAHHAKDVRWSGQYLRVYTDLPEYDDDSPDAVALCRVASSYLVRRLGKAQAIVFVHAHESDNGHVVLANKLDVHDSCGVDGGR